MDELHFKVETVKHLNTTEADSSMLKCGEIFVTKSEKFVLICGFCETSYDSMSEFGYHIRDMHLSDPNTNNEKPSDHESDDVNLPICNDDYFLPKEDEESCESKFAFEIENGFDSDVKSDNDSDDEVKFVLEYTHEDISSPESIPMRRARKKVSRKQNSGVVPCQFCEIICASQEKLEEHNKTHDPERPYTCHYCEKSFTTKSYCKHHMKVIHMGQKPHKCTKCSRSFGTRGKLRAHMLIHSMPGVYSCEICGRQFIYPSRREDHMRTHTGEKPFQCEICGRNFILRSRLTEHMKRHNNTKNHECDLCGKRFYTNVMLKDHLVMHSSEKPFECPECRQRFSRKKVLKMHLKIHSDVKQYGCDICGKAFAQFAGLYSHKKSHGKKLTE